MTRALLSLAALLACAGVGGGAQAAHVVKILERSYELGLSEIALPTGGVGTITVMPCATCKRVAHTATGATVYFLGPTRVPFAEFAKAVDAGRAAARGTFVGVYYDVESKHVNRVVLSVR
jgi:hypothetical protein